MYVFPGKTLNLKVEFTLGEDPASPEVAAYVVRDQTGEVQSATPIDVIDGDTDAWLSVPASIHVLTPGEKYRQHRIDVSYTVANMAIDRSYSYYVVPDLFLAHTANELRTVLGVSPLEIPNNQVEFYRAYIDLSAGRDGDAFIEALTGNDIDLKFAAQQLIFWHTAQLLLPSVRMQSLKSIESETSKMTRMATSTNVGALEDLVAERYLYYLSLIQVSGNASAPTFFIVDSPTDPVTGAA